MTSFNWLLWNQILLFEELSGGDIWRRIGRGRSESVRGGASPAGGVFSEEAFSESGRRFFEGASIAVRGRGIFL